MLRHQKLMATFLEQQKQVMLAYLNRSASAGRPLPASVVQPAAARLVQPPADRNVAPPARAAPARGHPPAASAGGGRSAAPSAPVDLMQQLVALVSERTGYPVEALAPKQNMEADLGIDSIKRVEILTSFARRFPEPRVRGAGAAAGRAHAPRCRAGDSSEPAPALRRRPAPARERRARCRVPGARLSRARRRFSSSRPRPTRRASCGSWSIWCRSARAIPPRRSPRARTWSPISASTRSSGSRS